MKKWEEEERIDFHTLQLSMTTRKRREEKEEREKKRERERERDSSGGFETFEVSIFLHRRGFAIRLHSTSPLK